MDESVRTRFIQQLRDESNGRSSQSEPETLMDFIKKLDDKKEWIDSRNPPEHPDLYGDAILLVGSTKQGKSTFVNCLLDKYLKCKFDEGEGSWVLENQSSSNNEPKISAMGQSETLWPTLYKKNGIKIWDMPGLNDNRSYKIELKQAAMTRLVITQHRSVSFVLVVEESVLKKQNQMELVELIDLLLKYSPDVAQHLFIVVSKSSKDDWKDMLKKLINWQPTAKNENRIKINRAKDVIQRIIDENAGFSFRIPDFKNKNEVYTYEFPEKQLLNKIANVEKIGIVNCPYVISELSFIPISNLMSDISSKNTAKLFELCKYFVRESKEKVKGCDKWKKEEQSRYIDDFLEILPDPRIKLTSFLDFVANNTSSGRNEHFYRLINELKSEFEVLMKLREIYNKDINCSLQNHVKDSIDAVKSFLEDYQKIVNDRPTSTCIIL